MRLFLGLIQFLLPAIYIRHISGKYGLICRKIGVETFVIIKLILPIFLLAFNYATEPVAFAITIYFLVDTVLYLLSLIFLSDVYSNPITYKRSILLLYINFIEIGLEYSVIFCFLNHHLVQFFKDDTITSTVDIVYFSFVSLSSVGFGDISISHPLGKILVVSQIFIFLLFVSLFLTFFSSKINDRTYFNDDSKNKKEST